MCKRLCFRQKGKHLEKKQKGQTAEEMKENNVKYRQKGTNHTLIYILFLNTIESYWKVLNKNNEKF